MIVGVIIKQTWGDLQRGGGRYTEGGGRANLRQPRQKLTLFDLLEEVKAKGLPPRQSLTALLSGAQPRQTIKSSRGPTEGGTGGSQGTGKKVEAGVPPDQAPAGCPPGSPPEQGLGKGPKRVSPPERSQRHPKRLVDVPDVSISV